MPESTNITNQPFLCSDFDPSQWVALGGSSNGETHEGNFQPSTQIKVIKRILIHPQARIAKGFVQNDLVSFRTLAQFYRLPCVLFFGILQLS